MLAWLLPCGLTRAGHAPGDKKPRAHRDSVQPLAVIAARRPSHLPAGILPCPGNTLPPKNPESLCAPAPSRASSSRILRSVRRVPRESTMRCHLLDPAVAPPEDVARPRHCVG